MSGLPLVSIISATKSFNNDPLFSEISFSINEGERLALIGSNGSGKSTILKIIAGLMEPDDGEVHLRNGIRLAYVAQEESFEAGTNVENILRAALQKFEWAPESIEEQLNKFIQSFDSAHLRNTVENLSGGWRKRLAILSGFIAEPDLILLDEPTNHLDIGGILWLEDLIKKSKSTVIFVSHDRTFIDHLAKRVIELNRIYPKGFFSQNGNYTGFCSKRIEFIDGLRKQKDALSNKVRREIEWLKQGAKARSTKSSYRTAKAHGMIAQLADTKLDESKVDFEFAKTTRKTKDQIKLTSIGKSFGEKPLFSNISLTIQNGDRIGIVGDNGTGKTSFLKVLLGSLAPDTGEVERAKNLQIAYFDQSRRDLDLSISLKEALSPDTDSVVFNGELIHVNTWAERFLFSREQFSLPIQQLSGGERARLILARLMLQPSDMLIFDEPTNDLDIVTLELLEESFNDYPGSIVLVTHDRYFLDRVSNKVIAFGQASGIYSDYSQWENAVVAQPGASSIVEEVKAKKLTKEEQKELNTIEKEILKAEKIYNRIFEELNDQANSSNSLALHEQYEKLSAQKAIIENLYNRWEELEEKKQS